MKSWRKIIGSPLGKSLALFLVINLLVNVCMPSMAFALTGGPSQPEFQGFTEIGTTNMVNEFTGDFSYEIPLMTVPGPNGGYPINLNYVAGASMEDEASWVGLGWTLNPGAINRNMRGVPDDFSGPQNEGGSNLVSSPDIINKCHFTKNNVTVGLGVGITLPPSAEVAGAELDIATFSPNVNLYYNTYSGLGTRIGAGLKLSAISNESGSGGLSANLNLNFDSNEGGSVQPSVSMSSNFSGKGKSTTTGITTGFNYNSREGITSTFLTTQMSRTALRSRIIMSDNGPVSAMYKKSSGAGNSITFASTTGVPSTSMAMFGVNAGFNLDFEAGALMTHIDIPISFNGMFSLQTVEHWISKGHDYPAYGTMYSGYRDDSGVDNDRALMDYNRENDWAINMKTPMLPMPVMTHDVFTVSGAQMGGAFRTFRNDVGVFYEPRVASDFIGATIGAEIAIGSPGFKVGLDPGINFSHSYSGKWKSTNGLNNSDIENVTTTNFFRKPSELVNSGLRKVQPFDFRFTTETTALIPGDNQFSSLGGEGVAGRYSLFPATADFPKMEDVEFEDPDATTSANSLFPFKNLGKFKAKASNKMNGMSILADATVRKEKERKIQLVEYRTKGEILKEIDYSNVNYLPEVMYNPADGSSLPFEIADAHIKEHHITEFSILQPGGMRYIYGLPLYNKVHEEYYFAIKGQNTSEKTVVINNLDNDILSKKKGKGGGDKMFNSTKISPYSHSHLLTHIVSPDYVDVDNDGPSDNDYGYWTKFTYYKVENYKWRVPLKENEVNYIKGYESSQNDDKATFTYGERDMTYIRSIETKTHIAIFELENRSDNLDVNGLEGGVNTSSNVSKRLEKIKLYAKSDLENPIKTVTFVYEEPEESLCQAIHNTSVVDGSGQPIGGKLTLKKIYFEYGNSTKGKLNPYIFEYGTVYEDGPGAGSTELVESGDISNPDYEMMHVDRWGNYKPEELGVSNEDRPYVDQTSSGEEQRQKNVTAWNLTGITLPTGAKIKIAYEMDDYAYVQDKPATQMYTIAGMGESISSIDWLDDDGESKILEDYKYVFFELDDQSADEDDVAKMVSQIPDAKLYFKTWQRLQIPKGISNPHWEFDYVTGYADIETSVESSGIITRDLGANDKNYGYLTLKTIDTDAKNWNAFRKAGIQYLRYQRADLARPQTQGDAAFEAVAMILGCVPLIIQNLELLSGFYNWSIAKNHCKFIGDGKPSFIKMGSADGVKYGGGHRVRKIVISDAWNDMAPNDASSSYGMEYFYHTMEGDQKISSGVASYEPIIGNDENPMKKAHTYGPDNKYIHNDPAFYLEEPIGESYFPAPVVGYSKVTKVNIANAKNIVTGDGIAVTEFYTAKDFPIKNTYTQDLQRIEDKQTIFIPLIASITLKGYGYSQGYYIELNDMHGKVKSESVHDADLWDKTTKNWVPYDGELGFTSKKIYKYKSNGKELINQVNVLNADREISEATMGVSSEMFSEMKEDFNYGFGIGGHVNFGVDPAPYGWFVSVWPNFEYNETSARTLVTTKVVYKNGILDEVLEMADGSVKKTKSIYYDPETGAPLLTAVTSDFDDSQSDVNDQYIYNYTYPAYWYYSGMQAAYRNYKNTYIFSNGTSTFPGADLYFEKGDELMIANGVLHGQTVWVTNIDDNAVTFEEKDGTVYIPANGTVLVTKRSGKRNLQTVPTGSLASLKNPVTAQITNTLFEYYNANVYHNPSYSSTFPNNLNETIDDLRDCADPSLVYNGTISYNIGNTPIYNGDALLIEFGPSEGGECNIVIPIANLGGNSFVPSKARFEAVSQTEALLVYDQPGGGVIETLVPIIPKCKLNFCMDGVLNAGADEFSDNWSYDAEFEPTTGPLALNAYLKGERGIWRKLRTNAYFSERKQRNTGNSPGVYNTYIGQDGIYSRFVIFDWLAGNNANVQSAYGWRWQAEVTPTGYSPYGFEIENRNAMNIYSSELYGYNNSVVVATSKNAAYPEIAFDGFEEIELGSPYAIRGHLPIQVYNITSSISDEQSHTGNQSIKLVIGSSGRVFVTIPLSDLYANFVRNGKVEMLTNRKYLLGFWYRFASPSTSIAVHTLDVENSFNDVEDYDVNTSSTSIDGWRRAEVIINPSLVTGNSLQLSITFGGSGTVYFDDIRIHPSDAPFSSHVYDPKNFMLRASLDDNNYATFYNYDEENTLIQVKKETAEGVRTIQTTRKNVRIKPQ